MTKFNGITYKTIIIFALGFAAGVSAHQAFTKEVESQVADLATLKQAGYIQEPFYVDEPVEQ